MNKQAQPNHIFVLTQKGYDYRLRKGHRIPEAGEPFTYLETSVPELWVNNGWVEEKEDEDE